MYHVKDGPWPYFGEQPRTRATSDVTELLNGFPSARSDLLSYFQSQGSCLYHQFLCLKSCSYVGKSNDFQILVFNCWLQLLFLVCGSSKKKCGLQNVNLSSRIKAEIDVNLRWPRRIFSCWLLHLQRLLWSSCLACVNILTIFDYMITQISRVIEFLTCDWLKFVPLIIFYEW